MNKYGKIVNEEIEYAPKVLIIDDKRIINPMEEHFVLAGYKKIVKTEMPVKEGYYYTRKFVDNGDVIIQEWEQHEIEQNEDFNIT